MSYSLNLVQIIGNVTKDPELRQAGQHNVTTVGVATNYSRKTKDGDYEDIPEFHNIVVWGTTAETACRYLKKGSKVYFQGRIQTKTWEAEDGTKRYKTEIVAEKMLLLNSKPKVEEDYEDDRSGPTTRAAEKTFGTKATTVKKTASNQEELGDPKDDLPF